MGYQGPGRAAEDAVSWERLKKRITFLRFGRWNLRVRIRCPDGNVWKCVVGSVDWYAHSFNEPDKKCVLP